MHLLSYFWKNNIKGLDLTTVLNRCYILYLKIRTFWELNTDSLNTTCFRWLRTKFHYKADVLATEVTLLAMKKQVSLQKEFKALPNH